MPPTAKPALPQVPLLGPAPPPEIQALLADLQDPDYQQWRRHPVSLVVLHFLADQSASLQAVTLHSWIQGALSLQNEQVIRGRVLALNDVLGLEWAAIQRFYADRMAQTGEQAREGKSASDNDRGL